MEREGHLARNLILILLLAVLCLGAAGLITCRFADPALYEQIVTPFVHLYHGYRGQVKHLSEEYALWLARQEGIRQTEGEAQRLRAEIRRREQEERRLLKRMAQDQDELFKLLDTMQLATAPLYEDGQMGEPDATELVIEDGQEYLTGGNVKLPYFNQSDEAWADLLFGQDPVKTFGCGPTALAMVISGLTDEWVTPGDMAAWAGRAGYSAPGSGSYLSIVRAAARRFGLACTPVAPLDSETLVRNLQSGGIAVALMGPGHFTARGHFILLRGLTEEGQVLVADPNSRENSLSVWDPVTITSELSPSRAEGAPLWMITRSVEGG